MNPFDHPLIPFPSMDAGQALARKGEEIISEGHPFDFAQGRLSDSRQRGFAPLHTPFFGTLIVHSSALFRSAHPERFLGTSPFG